MLPSSILANHPNEIFGEASSGRPEIIRLCRATGEMLRQVQALSAMAPPTVEVKGLVQDTEDGSSRSSSSSSSSGGGGGGGVGTAARTRLTGPKSFHDGSRGSTTTTTAASTAASSAASSATSAPVAGKQRSRVPVAWRRRAALLDASRVAYMSAFLAWKRSDMDRLAAEVRAPFVQLLTLQLQFQEKRRQENGLLEPPVSPLAHPALVEMAERVKRLIGAERAEGWVAEAQEQAEGDVRRQVAQDELDKAAKEARVKKAAARRAARRAEQKAEGKVEGGGGSSGSSSSSFPSTMHLFLAAIRAHPIVSPAVVARMQQQEEGDKELSSAEGATTGETKTSTMLGPAAAAAGSTQLQARQQPQHRQQQQQQGGGKKEMGGNSRALREIFSNESLAHELVLNPSYQLPIPDVHMALPGEREGDDEDTAAAAAAAAMAGNHGQYSVDVSALGAMPEGASGDASAAEGPRQAAQWQAQRASRHLQRALQRAQ